MAQRLSKTDVEKLPPGLADDVITAAIHYRLWKDIRESIGDYESEFSQSGTFWFLTINAQLTTAKGALFRAYDGHRDGLNLRGLIETLGQHCNLPRNDIDADKLSVSKGDPLVDKLIWQRNNTFAHKNLENVVNNRTPEQKNSLTTDEFEELLKRAVDILNKYDTNFRRHSWSTQMMGHDDFKHVLTAIRHWIKSEDEKIHAEIDQAPGA